MPDILIDVLGIFLGALLGVPAGLALNHAWESRVAAERRRQFCLALKDSVERNAGLLEQFETWLAKPGGTPFFNVDLTLLESTADAKYEILNNFELCCRIDNLRFELAHLSRKVDLLLALEFNPASRMAIDDPKGSMYLILRPPLVASIQSHVTPIRNLITQLRSDFKAD